MHFVDKDYNRGLRQESELILLTKDYDKSDRLKDILHLIYSGTCVYCESTPEASSFFQIEHFYPKTRFALWKNYFLNLHYCCQRCNQLKGDRKPSRIFSPNYYFAGTGNWICTDPDKIGRELVYIGHLAFAFNRTGSPNRAKATISMFDLNNDRNKGRVTRRFLVMSRLRTLASVYYLLEVIIDLLEFYPLEEQILQSAQVLMDLVLAYTLPSSPFSSMVIHNFGDDILRLLTLLRQQQAIIATF